MTFLRILFVLLLALAAFEWFSDTKPLSSALTLTKPLSFSPANYSASAIAARTQALPAFSSDGVVITDTTVQPNEPYFLYQSASGSIQTKIIKTSENATCEVSVGDLPCVQQTGTGAQSTHTLLSGTFVHAIGNLDDQDIQLTAYGAPPKSLTSMTEFRTTVGNSTLLSDGLLFQVSGVQYGSTCELGLGCFSSTTPRVTAHVSVAKTTDVLQFVPGRIVTWHGMGIVLTSTEGTQNPVLTFLVVQE